MIEEVVEIICKGCIVHATCDMPCDTYREVFNPVYRQMNTIEERIGRKLSPDEVKQLAIDSAKGLTKGEDDGY
jgi:5,10-methenyltetrahydromethanopterin hydrogenase